jgi:hypothetical protein
MDNRLRNNPCEISCAAYDVQVYQEDSERQDPDLAGATIDTSVLSDPRLSLQENEASNYWGKISSQM